MAIRIHVQAARRAMVLATFGAALVVGQASGEELPSQQPTGQWVLTPITPIAPTTIPPAPIPPAAWLHNSRTGELFLRHHVGVEGPSINRRRRVSPDAAGTARASHPTRPAAAPNSAKEIAVIVARLSPHSFAPAPLAACPRQRPRRARLAAAGPV
jgi:hypothetical protein